MKNLRNYKIKEMLFKFPWHKVLEKNHKIKQQQQQSTGAEKFPA